MTGKQTTHVEPAAVLALVREFEAIDFFSLRGANRVVENPDGTVTHVTDLPTTFVSLRLGNRSKRIEDYFGGPEALRDLDAASTKWQGPDSGWRSARARHPDQGSAVRRCGMNLFVTSSPLPARRVMPTSMFEVMRGDVVRARQALQQLLVERIRFTPINITSVQRTYRLEATLSLGGMLDLDDRRRGHVPDGICTSLFPKLPILVIVKRAA